MNDKTYHTVAGNLLSEAMRIESAKCPAYTIGSDDVLANFKSIANRAKLTSMQVWLVYFLKHVDAISAFAADPNIPQAEDIDGRFADAINYLKLGYALYFEATDLYVNFIEPFEEDY